MNNILGLLDNDWKKIPQNLRYLVWFGVFLIFNSWLLDHWGTKNSYLFWVWDIRQLGYSVGASTILLAFGMLVVKQLAYFATVVWYRMIKYPINKLDDKFYLVWFKGKLYLFDNDDMIYRHVRPWGTAQDLDFVGRGYNIDSNFGEYKAIKIGTRKFIRPGKYKAGPPIITNTEGD